ncbi:putative u3 small nucleolar rna-associated protein utp11 [Phaeomoniella chlamydospora]|uniref:U3 small nucleolar RNA-associated protein 11 n=1 Tax=Phaeomoniella chlamydospora TaxID=158046 RepID=A0A0G2G5S3_PHACM|nr:putative u3 small nucleolar rna-associated protein utp11 [Phaeomoniella chlamydospora]
MSSMRNAVQRRNHKERSQVSGHYNLKKKKLSILSQKASERNPDEFAFGMLSAEKSKQGKHGQNSLENRLSHDTVKLLKTQDQGYLRTVGQKSRRELEELEREINVAEAMERIGDERANGDDPGTKDSGERTKISSPPPNKKTIFLDPSSPPIKSIPNPSTTSPPSRSASSTPPPPQSTSKTSKNLANQRRTRKLRARLREVRASKLQALKQRQKEILKAAEELELQRARMSGAIGGVNKDGVKFRRRERKR